MCVCACVSLRVALEGVFNVSEETFCRGAPALMNEGRDPNIPTFTMHLIIQPPMSLQNFALPHYLDYTHKTHNPIIHQDTKDAHTFTQHIQAHFCMLRPRSGYSDIFNSPTQLDKPNQTNKKLLIDMLCAIHGFQPENASGKFLLGQCHGGFRFI